LSVLVRPAAPGDAEAIARTHVQAWNESYRGLIPDAAFDDHSVETRVTQWHGTLGNPDVLVRVVEHNGAIRGFGSAGKPRTELPTAAEIYSFYLLDEVKRRGVGRMLFTRLREELAARGFASLGLWVLSNNAPARRFYEAMGGRSGEIRVDRRGEFSFDDIAYIWDAPAQLR
jgi:ribosomal protein S18 acetylase RimI-like enzyme